MKKKIDTLSDLSPDRAAAFIKLWREEIIKDADSFIEFLKTEEATFDLQLLAIAHPLLILEFFAELREKCVMTEKLSVWLLELATIAKYSNLADSIAIKPEAVERLKGFKSDIQKTFRSGDHIWLNFAEKLLSKVFEKEEILQEGLVGGPMIAKALSKTLAAEIPANLSPQPDFLDENEALQLALALSLASDRNVSVAPVDDGTKYLTSEPFVEEEDEEMHLALELSKSKETKVHVTPLPQADSVKNKKSAKTEEMIKSVRGILEQSTNSPEKAFVFFSFLLTRLDQKLLTVLEAEEFKYSIHKIALQLPAAYVHSLFYAQAKHPDNTLYFQYMLDSFRRYYPEKLCSIAESIAASPEALALLNDNVSLLFDRQERHPRITTLLSTQVCLEVADSIWKAVEKNSRTAEFSSGVQSAKNEDEELLALTPSKSLENRDSATLENDLRVIEIRSLLGKAFLKEDNLNKLLDLLLNDLSGVYSATLCEDDCQALMYQLFCLYPTQMVRFMDRAIDSPNAPNMLQYLSLLLKSEDLITALRPARFALLKLQEKLVSREWLELISTLLGFKPEQKEIVRKPQAIKFFDHKLAMLDEFIKPARQSQEQAFKFLAFLLVGLDNTILDVLKLPAYKYIIHEIVARWPEHFVGFIFHAQKTLPDNVLFFNYLLINFHSYYPAKDCYLAELIAEAPLAISLLAQQFKELANRVSSNKNQINLISTQVCMNIAQSILDIGSKKNPQIFSQIMSGITLNNNFKMLENQLNMVFESPDNANLLFDALIFDESDSYLRLLSEQISHILIELSRVEPQRFIKFMVQARDSSNSANIRSFVENHLDLNVLANNLDPAKEILERIVEESMMNLQPDDEWLSLFQQLLNPEFIEKPNFR